MGFFPVSAETGILEQVANMTVVISCHFFPRCIDGFF